MELLHLICICRSLHGDENLGLLDVKFTHTSTQGTAVEPKDLYYDLWRQQSVLDGVGAAQSFKLAILEYSERMMG